MIKQKQYRPYLTAEEIATILANSELKEDKVNKSICSKMKLLSLKIEAGIIRECYVTNPKPTTLEKLGGTSPDEVRYLNGEMSPEEEEQYLDKLMKGNQE